MMFFFSIEIAEIPSTIYSFPFKLISTTDRKRSLESYDILVLAKKFGRAKRCKKGRMMKNGVTTNVKKIRGSSRRSHLQDPEAASLATARASWRSRGH